MKILSSKKLLVLAMLLAFVLCACLTAPAGENQFSHLAKSFLHGHLYLPGIPTDSPSDVAPFNGRIYWALGPLPAVLLMPLVLVANVFGVFLSQASVHVALVVAVLWLVRQIAGKLGYSEQDSWYLAFGFVLASAFIGIAGSSRSWYFGQAVAVGLAFGALLEYFGTRRWWRIGALCALLLLTRVSASFIALFFALEILRSNQKLAVKKRQLMMFAAPLAAALVLLCTYNYLRFGNIFEQGYTYQMIARQYGDGRAVGLLSPSHIPTNFFYMFLSGPETYQPAGSYSLTFPYFGNNAWGMSIFLTSPYLLYLFTMRRGELTPQIKYLLASVLLTLIFVLCWYSTGFRQFASRMSLDFLPAVFVIFMLLYRQRNKALSPHMKRLLFASALFNFYLVCSFLGLIKLN